jgi:hypothetical protein
MLRRQLPQPPPKAASSTAPCRSSKTVPPKPGSGTPIRRPWWASSISIPASAASAPSPLLEVRRKGTEVERRGTGRG